jgi:putative Ca2+/H+ antiporter (TMEM165/GDT1 family)
MQAAREDVAAKGVSSQKHPEGVQHTSSSTSSSTSSHNSSSSSDVGSSGALSPQHSADAEFAEAQEMVAAAASRGLLGQHSTAQHGGSRTKLLLRSVLEVAAVMFLAEWGDRSMLATVALGTAQVGHSFAVLQCDSVPV